MHIVVRRIAMVLAAIAVLPSGLLAQQTRQVTGQVTAAETGQPLAGAQVMVKGQAIGTVTDASGRYQLTVPQSATTLVFSMLGYGTVEAEITGDVVNATLASQAIALEGIVVTALGLEQEKRALSTSVADISGEALADVPEPNIVSALSGEAAGVVTTTAGVQGGSARIVIRGANTIAGDNQPLFVVDGVPIDNSAPSLDGYGGWGGTYDTGNAASDINPADIESMTVLKGPAAAALYGSRAANGAIIITTKKGSAAARSGGSQINFQSSMTWSTPLRLPEYQNQYGQGYTGEFEYVDGLGGGTGDYADESWGPPCDGRPIVQWWSNGEPAPFTCDPDNVRKYFETGLTTTNNISFATATENANVRLSVGNEHIDGMYPGFEQDKWTIGVNGGMLVTERLRAEAGANYIRRHGERRPGIGYDANNPMQQFVWFGRSVHIDRLKEAYKKGAANNEHISWNPLFHTNPYWLALKNYNFDNRDRIFGHASLHYRLADGLTATARVGSDWYQDHRKEEKYADGSNYFYDAFYEVVSDRRETNYQLMINHDRELTPDITFSGMVGAEHRYTEYNWHRVYVPELTIPGQGIFTVSNSARPVQASDRFEQTAMNSLFGRVQFGFRNYLFIEATGRNDWASTLPAGNNSYFYPSVSGSFVFSDAFDHGLDFLSFGKLRASWAEVGNDADPYQLQAYYSAGTSFNSQFPAYAVPNVIPNKDLKPMRTRSWEVGADFGFFDNRLGLEATYYNTTTYDQILATDISAASGFNQRVVNAGEIANRGVELRLTATPLSLDNGFRWDVAVNFAKNESEVVSLAEGLETVELGSYWGVTTEARVGYPYGTLFGNGFLRDPEGRIVLDKNGLPLATSERIPLGSYDPDWSGSLSNTFSYGGLQFSFMLDTRQGGNIFSVTQAFGEYTGVLSTTLKGREEYFGPDPDGAVDPETGEPIIIALPGFPVSGVIQTGTDADGNPIYEEFSTRVRPDLYYKSLFDRTIREAHVYDASYIKLREARLSYTFPQSIMARLPFSSLTMSLIGRNLALWTDMPNIDPETSFDAGNAQGFEFGQLPAPRSFGLSINVTP